MELNMINWNNKRPALEGKVSALGIGKAIYAAPDGDKNNARLLLAADGFHFKSTDFDDLVLPGLSFESTKGTKYDLSFDDDGALLINGVKYTLPTNQDNETIGGSKTFSSTINGNLNGNSTTATKLAISRTIGGVSFNGTADIVLSGVNAKGNQDTSGNADTATKLQTARTINGVAFDGTANISVNASNDASLVHKTGNETVAGVKTFSDWPVVTGLNVSNGTNTSGIIRTNTSIQKQSNNNVPVAINTGSTLAVGGGEAANAYLTAMAAGAVPIGSTNAGNEQLVLVGDAAVYIGAGYQRGGTTGKWWAFNQNGTVTSPNGNLLQEVNNGSIRIYGLGTYFATDKYLTLTYSGKVISIQGELKATVDISGGSSQGELLIPTDYRPVATRMIQVGFNSSSAREKVFADVYINKDGMISIDNIVNGSNMTAWGTIPAGSTLNISDAWVLA